MSFIILSLPGDLTLTRLPTGEIALCEVVGVNRAGFGDVTFEHDPTQAGLFCREGRTPRIDALIGRTFATFRDGVEAVVKADPIGHASHRAAGPTRTDSHSAHAWAKALAKP